MLPWESVIQNVTHLCRGGWLSISGDWEYAYCGVEVLNKPTSSYLDAWPRP